MHVGNGNVPYRSDAVYAKEALAEYGNAFAEAATARETEEQKQKQKKQSKKRHGTEKSVSFFASGGSRNENQTGNLADTSYKMQKRRTETNTYDEKLLKI